MKLPVVYSQHDIRWNDLKLGGSNSSIGGYGCTIAVYSMLAEYYGHHINPAGFNKLMIEKGLYVGTYKNLYSMNAITKLFPDIKYRGFTDTPNAVTDEQFALIHRELDNKRPVVIKVKTSRSYHYVLATDYTGQGLEIVDPIDGRIRTLRSRYGTDRFAIHRYVFHTGILVNTSMPTLDFSQGSFLADTNGKYNASVGLVEIIEQRGGNVVIQAFWPDGTEFKREVPFHELTLLNRDTKTLEEEIERLILSNNNSMAQLKTALVSEGAAKARATNLDEMLAKTKTDIKREVAANKIIRDSLMETSDKLKQSEGENYKLVKQVIAYSSTLKRERKEWEKEEVIYKENIKELEKKLLENPSFFKQVVNKITVFILKVISRWKRLKV